MSPPSDPESLSERDAAIAAYQRGAPDAADRIAAALDKHPYDGGLLISEAGLKLERGEEDALARLERVVGQAPDWVDGQLALARFRWESGDADGYCAAIERALQAMPRQAGLWRAYIQILAGTSRHGDAADAAADARQKGFDLPMLRLIEALHAGMDGQTDRAGALLADLPEELPDLPLQRARHAVRIGDLDAAQSELGEARRRFPDDISAWALTETLWRAVDDPRHDWLVGDPVFARPIALDLDAAALDAVATVLRTLHGWRTHPLGQSVREGTQTHGDLFRREDPPIAGLREALAAAVADYWAGLPPADENHPLLRGRDARPGFVTGWSIRIAGGGHHVSHVHPEGILSSACYIVVPEGLDSTEREGWIELGRPPADLRLDLEPLAAFEPKPGRLVLFPSYLYHGTRPFRSGERLTVAFDIGVERQGNS